jgi:hypothetical protein
MGLSTPIALLDRTTRTILVIALTVTFTGCGQQSPDPRSGKPAGESSQAAPTPSLAQVQNARRFRTAFGLRADDAWILAVAADPSSADGNVLFSVPLLPNEAADLIARSRASFDAGPVILKYAATIPDDWYGSYIDQKRTGIIVVQVYRNEDRHRAALESPALALRALGGAYGRSAHARPRGARRQG